MFALPKKRSGPRASTIEGARGTVVSCAKRPVGVPSCPAPPRPAAAPPCAAPPRPAYGVSGFWVRQVSGHALHEKGLQRQVGIGTLVSSQERRAAVVLVVNRTLCSPNGLHKISFVRASEESSKTVILDALEEKRVVLSPGRTDPPASHIAPPGHAPPPRRAPPRLPHPWHVRVLDSTGWYT